jgi:rubredoxin
MENTSMAEEKNYLALALVLLSTAVISACSSKTEVTKPPSTDMRRYACPVEDCGYLYDPKRGDPVHGIAPGTSFIDIPDDWRCPICGASKDRFYAVNN